MVFLTINSGRCLQKQLQTCSTKPEIKFKWGTVVPELTWGEMRPLTYRLWWLLLRWYQFWCMWVSATSKGWQAKNRRAEGCAKQLHLMHFEKIPAEEAAAFGSVSSSSTRTTVRPLACNNLPGQCPAVVTHGSVAHYADFVLGSYCSGKKSSPND